jgi:hypothetical protein
VATLNRIQKANKRGVHFRACLLRVTLEFLFSRLLSEIRNVKIRKYIVIARLRHLLPYRLEKNTDWVLL